MSQKYEIRGAVTQILPGGKFNVSFEMQSKTHEIETIVSGKMREFKIKIVRGDDVLVTIDPQSIQPNQKLRGQIVRRFKK